MGGLAWTGKRGVCGLVSMNTPRSPEGMKVPFLLEVT